MPALIFWIHVAGNVAGHSNPSAYFCRPGTGELDATSAATAAIEAGTLKDMQSQAATIPVGNTNGSVGAPSSLLDALAELPAHDPAGQVFTDVTAVYLLDISSLMPPPAPIPAKVDVKKEPQVAEGQATAAAAKSEGQQEGADAEMTDAAAVADGSDNTAAVVVKDVTAAAETGEPEALLCNRQYLLHLGLLPSANIT